MNDHPCFVCGSHVAPFGCGPAGAKVRDEPHKFMWYCRVHRPDREPFEEDVAVVDTEVKEEFEVPF